MGREARIVGIRHNQWFEGTNDIPLAAEVVEWDRNRSMQALSGMLGLAAGVGSSTSTTPRYLAGIMGEVFQGATVDAAAINLTATANVIAGVIGKYSHKGTNASTYMGAAVRAEIGNGVTAARAAVLAVLGGDLTASTAPAAFGVDCESSIAVSRFNFGIDFEGPGAHDGYFAPRYNSGFIRMGGRVQNAAGAVVTVADIVVLAGTAAPTNGASGTGAGVAGPGSLYIQQSGSTSTLQINTNTLASPTWSAIP